MDIEMRRTDDLIPNARNARVHPESQVDQIIASIRNFGFLNPVLIDGQGGVIAGHGRLMAAKRMGMTEVPCVRHDHLSEAQKRAYMLADNKIAANAGWDELALRDELMSLGGLPDLDLSVVGFSESELDSILGQSEKLKEKTENLAPITMSRILLSFPTDRGLEVGEAMKPVLDLGFVEIDYGGN